MQHVFIGVVVGAAMFVVVVVLLLRVPRTIGSLQLGNGWSTEGSTYPCIGNSRMWLARAPDGNWANPSCTVSRVPRKSYLISGPTQNGKGGRAKVHIASGPAQVVHYLGARASCTLSLAPRMLYTISGHTQTATMFSASVGVACGVVSRST